MNIIKTVALLCATTFMTSSCEDWLTIYPQDRVVEENFWEDKNDLEGVRYAAYKNMVNTIDKFVIWGDLRSDAYILNPAEPESDKGTYLTYKKVIQAMPDSSMSMFDWGGVYTTINFCNKVLAHGEEVLAKDKQFTKREWRQMKAEVMALRALNYFYLIRAFKDVPYTTKVINSDAEIGYFPQTNQLVVLDSCIYSLEGNIGDLTLNESGMISNSTNGILGNARNRFSSKSDSKGLITNSAIYAMLADMYLWRASLRQGRWSKTKTSVIAPDSTIHTPITDYERSAMYADQALAALALQNQEEDKNFTTSNSLFKEDNLAAEILKEGATPNCLMISNNFKTSASSLLSLELPVFEQLYTIGNSRESILELQVKASDGSYNYIVNSLFTPSSSTHLATCLESYKQAYADQDRRLCDTRYWMNCYDHLSQRNANGNAPLATKAGIAPYCVKYAAPQALFRDGAERELTVSYQSSSRRNFIIYRMADMMLIKAEALMNANNTKNRKAAYALVNGVRRRNYCQYKSTEEAYSATLSELSKFNCVQNDTTFIMNERLIEFTGEGKRWFDLVRYAERNAQIKVSGNVVTAYDIYESTPEDPILDGARGVYDMASRFLKNSQANYYKTLITRMQNRYGLYSPIYEYEVKANGGTIHQNPVWNKSKYDK